MTSNTAIFDAYLVQALENYRVRTEGQFGSATESVLQLTQDAAAQIKRLNAEIDALQRRVISITREPLLPPSNGNVTFWNWAFLAKVAEEREDGKRYVKQLTIEKECVCFQWGYRDEM